MLELCARRENKPAKREGTLNRGRQVSSSYTCKLNLRVLCPNHLTGKEKHLSGLESSLKGLESFVFSRATPPTLTLWDEHTSIAQCSTKCCVKRPARAQIKCLCFLPSVTSRALSLSFSACRREKWH